MSELDQTTDVAETTEPTADGADSQGDKVVESFAGSADTGSEKSAVDQAFDAVEAAEKQAEPTAAAKPNKTETPKPSKRNFKLKIDGEEQDFEIDETDLPRYIQKGLAAEKKFNEAARQRKDAELKLAKIKEDPWSVIKELGLDPNELAEKYVIDEYERKTMSPEQRKLYDMEQQNQELMKFKEAYEQEKASREYDSKVQQYSTRYEQELNEVLASGELPETTASMNLLVQAFQERLESIEDPEDRDQVSLKDVVQDVKKYYQEELRAALSYFAKDPIALEKMLGPDLFKQLREIDLAKYKAARAPATQAKKAVEEQKNAIPKFKSWEDLEKYYGK
jgi:hypothetical protein